MSPEAHPILESPLTSPALYVPHKSRPNLLSSGKSLCSRLQWYAPPRRLYTRRELLADRIVNFTGSCLSLVAGPVLVYMSWAAGNTGVRLFGFSVYALGLIIMLNVSAFYHFWSWNWESANRLLILDHLGINSLIMGNYAPLMVYCGCFRILGFVLLIGTLGWLLQAWELSTEKNGSPPWFPYMHELRYVVMGWACAPVLPIMVATIPHDGFAVLFAAGVIYTVGVGIFLWEDLEYHLPIWHFMVLVASAFSYYTCLRII